MNIFCSSFAQKILNFFQCQFLSGYESTPHMLLDTDCPGAQEGGVSSPSVTGASLGRGWSSPALYYRDRQLGVLICVLRFMFLVIWAFCESSVILPTSVLGFILMLARCVLVLFEFEFLDGLVECVLSPTPPHEFLIQQVWERARVLTGSSCGLGLLFLV